MHLPNFSIGSVCDVQFQGNTHLITTGTGRTIAEAQTNAFSEVPNALTNLFKKIIFKEPNSDLVARYETSRAGRRLLVLNQQSLEVWLLRGAITVSAWYFIQSLRAMTGNPV